jgi:hypothetical protein
MTISFISGPDDPVLPLHWSFGDRLRDAWLCLIGRAFVLRYADRSIDYRFARTKPLIVVNTESK